MSPVQEKQRLNDLIAFKRFDGSVLAFHSQNLRVAQLSEEAFESISRPDTELHQQLLDWNDSKDPGVQKEVRQKGLKSVTINVTQVCNLTCKYCAAGGDGTYGDPIKRISVEQTIPSLRKLMQTVPQGERFRLTFLGGEPFLYPQGIEVLAETARAWAEELKFSVAFTVVTNGTLLTPENIELIKKFKMDVTISLDGPAGINDQRRPTVSGRGLTDKVEQGIQQLVRERSQTGTLLISGVFGKGNLDLVQAYHYYKQFGVDWFDFTYDHHESSPEINREFQDQMARVAEIAFAENGEAGLRKIHTFDRWIDQLDRQQQIENFCGAGQTFLMMDAAQNLTICPWLVGKPSEKVGQNGVVAPEKVEAYQKPLIEANGCGNCWARFLCGGGCMYIHSQATGDKHTVDKNFCNRTQFLLQTTLSYYEKMRQYEKVK